MSRIGNRPIVIPAGVTITIGDDVQVKGPKGSLNQTIVSLVSVAVTDNVLVVSRKNDSKPARANHGLMRALIQNMVTGVTAGYTKQLEIIGIGYRADVRGSKLVMQLGYSHPIEFDLPKGVDIVVDKQNNVTITGIDKCEVGQVAANIRDFRRPDHYKGKGIRYKGERVRIKAGKSA
jgi:large subunit ribosomal protein L6